MKKTLQVALVVSGLLLAFNCFAEDKPNNEATTPSSTITNQKREIKTIFSYKTELGLTDQQIQTIKQSITQLQTTLGERAKQISALSQDLLTMIKNRENVKLIRDKLEKIANLQVDNSISDIETSRGIEDVLTPAQLKKWKNIQMEAQEKLKAQQKGATQKK